MKTRGLLLAAVVYASLAFGAGAQTVVVTGACTPATVVPARCYGAVSTACNAPVGCVAQGPCVTPVYAALAGQCASPNVIYFGGPNSRYQNPYGCRNSSVIYFGRGQAYYGGYAFTRFR